MTLVPAPDPLPSAAYRRCYDCGAVKPVTAFAFQNKAKGTLQGRCRPCHARYRRGHYLRNRATYIKQEVARIRKYRRENRPLLREYLRAHPCVDCGETDIVVLEFDHRDPLSKSYNVTLLALHKPWDRVMAEIAKCDIRCANCHRRRTALQFKWRAGKLQLLSSNKNTRAQISVGPIELEFAAGGQAEKKCGKCGETKPLSLFPFKNRSRGKRASICLACMSGYSRSHYQRNRSKYLQKAHRSRTPVYKRNALLVLAYLLAHPCVDCGESDPILLDFDHRDRSAKVDDVSTLAHRRPWSVVLKEIEQCDIRCANCHRRKTARDFGWSRLESVAGLTLEVALEHVS